MSSCLRLVNFPCLVLNFYVSRRLLHDFVLIFFQRRTGDPLRVYMDLEAGRKRSGVEDMFVSYHAEDDVQSTYAGGLFHNGRNYHVSSQKKNVSTWLWLFFS